METNCKDLLNKSPEELSDNELNQMLDRIEEDPWFFFAYISNQKQDNHEPIS